MSYTGITAFLIALPHILYAAIWYQPQIWRAQFRGLSVEIFSRVASALKVIQFAAILGWLIANSSNRHFFLPSKVPGTLWAACTLTICIGQILNISIYQAIGKAGVYYGFKLGQPVPWHTGFPFNVVKHPQYVGSVMTIWGLGALLWSQAPAGFTSLLTFWTMLYVLTGLQEHLS